MAGPSLPMRSTCQDIPALSVFPLVTLFPTAILVIFSSRKALALSLPAILHRRWRQERKSLIQAESLRKLVRNKVTVVRSGNEVHALRQPSPLNFAASDILLEQLVPGDIVLLSAGDMVPGDLRLMESRDCV